MSGDGSRLVVRDGHALRVLRTDRSGCERARRRTATRAPTSTRSTPQRIVVTVDPAAEWRQMFDEAGRLMRDHFWVADMAGVDWAAELARYRPLVDAVGSHDDLVDLLWELQGELGTSHAYVSGAPAGPATTGRPALLGADLRTAADGTGWRVARVLPPETSDPGRAQPARPPGRRRPGGRRDLEVERPARWTRESGPRRCWSARAGELVELTVRTGPARRARRGAPGRRAAAGARRPRCATRTGWPGAGRTSPSAPTGGWATCTCPT